MISDEQQETASLYALGLLDLGEAAEFERALASSEEFRALTRDLRDAAALVAREPAQTVPPPALRAKVLERISAEAPAPSNVVPMWIPWAAAAALAICCGLLTAREGGLRRELAAVRGAAQFTAPTEGLERIAFVELDAVPQTKPAPRAAVAWDQTRREGILRLSHLEPPAPGKDYQLWVVEDGIKDPVNAGVVHVDGEGSAQTAFKPLSSEARRALAFAVSVERAGGVPKSEGPILLLGKL